MATIQSQQITQFAQERFQRISLPQGTDRARFATYIGSMCGAIGSALEDWRKNARLTGVKVMAVSAVGGKLFFDTHIEQLIIQRAPPGWDAYTRAIAAGVHNQIKSFSNDVSVPGLPWYPAFAAFPGPQAPPMPNVPCPLMSIAAVGTRHLKEGAITDMIFNKMPNPKPACGKDVAVAIAFGIEKVIFSWLSVQQVMMVMGKGPVPTFAPPYLPVGPVVDGSILENGRHLAS